MKKIFTLVYISLFMATAAHATTHVINQTGITWNPALIQDVQIGDIIEWQWSGGTHTTTSILVPGSAATWDSPITSGNPTFQYTVEVAGTYGYKCTPHFSSEMVGSFIVDSPDAILEVQSATNMNVSTNSQRNTVVINMTTIAAGEATLKLIDISGRVIATLLHQEIGTGNTIIEHQLDGLNRGIYFIHFSLNGQEVTKKFIVG